MNLNPFSYGRPTSTASFFNRHGSIRRVVGRLLSGGQSTAIIGQPRIGKTSFLQYLYAPENRSELYGIAGAQTLFSFINLQAMMGQYTQVHFWEQALKPVKEQFVDSASGLPVATQYQLCHHNNFGTFTLDKLFTLLQQAEWRLVLLLDEFDTLLNHPFLNSAEFYGGLRMLASERGSLSLIIASSLPLKTLNRKTQEINPTGSPYFNIFAEITLGSFPEQDINALLDQAGTRFTLWDKRVIQSVAGGNPYLLQSAAAAMWEAHEKGLTEVERRYDIWKSLYREHDAYFEAVWRRWTPAMQKAFTIVALAHTAHLLPQRQFLIDTFVNGLRDFGPELNDLETYGLITRDEQVQGGWRVVPQAMLRWLADELVRAVRDDEMSFEDWLQNQELKNLLTKKERDMLGKMARGAADALDRGSNTFIEGFAKGLGEALGKKV